MNSEAQETQDLAKDVAIQVGRWKGMVSLLSLPLDNSNLILRNKFFMMGKVMVFPHLNG